MAKLAIFAAIALAIVGTADVSEARPSSTPQERTEFVLSALPPATHPALTLHAPTTGAIDLCKTCIGFAGDALQELLNLILNKAVIGSCSKLCGALENATHNPGIGKTCSVLCDIYGIKAFIKWIENTDLSPYYDCQELGVCKYNDNGDAEITAFGATPTSGPSGTKFDVAFTFATKNGTSTGELRVRVYTLDDVQLQIPSDYIPDSTTAGSFNGNINLDTTPADPGCDPTQNACERWIPGTYTVELRICAGECGDVKHPHAKLYAAQNTTFTITSGPGPAPPPPGPPGPPPPPGPPGKHYEDPNAGPCAAGEDAVQITGLSGSFCSPSCSSTSPCPSDVPDGATATPTCALEKSGTTQPTQCALICNPNADSAAVCPDKASCKAISGTGICTYDS
mmetsp:Transcript_36559/g.95700  ORF Transcript_36559/g.95700 Transcript_36559/m.95700 type:complete len:396 (-) Transcript_36559:93-1280(-)|eukprot:CAMPEP_0182915410 /NCGR_PEP_ID=MMETSP0105_2-20130417/312_1 /TAXON_ID=81532 ORGANISM="Acanthoeca-like sp., Strain 10tr" /NCGR_SAMPLE_ID=MMETSP0105_2 /ASSEMBLY_ACC=CAM_ASM_000205 /LENGTH=395 /DNA_ID=CAMNT_0025052277 /DNA_START=18 /DNA_END=1205 /DNA_ORIENTATION=+